MDTLPAFDYCLALAFSAREAPHGVGECQGTPREDNRKSGRTDFLPCSHQVFRHLRLGPPRQDFFPSPGSPTVFLGTSRSFCRALRRASVGALREAQRGAQPRTLCVTPAGAPTGALTEDTGGGLRRTLTVGLLALNEDVPSQYGGFRTHSMLI